MWRLLSCIVCFCGVATNVFATDLDIALQKTYVSCVGISDMLSDVKKLAGINTVVTGVGTVAGGGALVAGIKKAKLLNRLQEIEDSSPEDKVSFDDLEIQQRTDFKPNLKSRAKKLGNWRTGLLAVNTATNVAGAVIAHKNANNVELEEKIVQCTDSINNLQDAIAKAKFENLDTTEAVAIYDACSEYKYVDLSVLKKRAKGAEISSVVGGGAGAVGIITSAVANNSSGEKEKNLDTVSNVLAGGATVLTGSATVFNALQISAVKKIVGVADNCESLLK